MITGAHGPQEIAELLFPLISLFYLFAGTGIAAYDFLCPNLHLLSIHTGLSEAVIGATFIAFGNASGDLFSSFVAFRNGNPSLALGSVVGAAFFIICVVIGVLALLQPTLINKRIFLRDAFFLVIAVSGVIFIIADGVITLHESLSLVALYALYSTVLIRSERQGYEEPEYSHAAYMHLHPDLDDGPLRPSFVEAIEHFHDADGSRGSASLSADSPATSPPTSPRLTLQVPRAQIGLDDTPPISPIGKRSPALSIHSRMSAHDLDEPPSLLEHFLPIFPQWSDFPISLKVFNLVMWPMLALLQLTVPIAQRRQGSAPRNFMSIYSVTTLLALYLVALPHSTTSQVLTAAASLLLLALSRIIEVSVLVPAFAGFAVSIIWILFLATHMVDIVKYLGSLLNIPKAVLGLTVVAIGNSLGDLVSNISIARSDHSTMALSACFGSPLLLIMMGLGGSSLLAMLLDNKTVIDVPKSKSVTTSCVLLLLTLMFLTVALPLNHWKINRPMGAVCVGIWVLNTALNLTIYS